MGGSRWGKVVAAAILTIAAGAVSGGAASAGTRGAGLDAELIVRGPGPDAVLAGLTLEVYLDNSGTFEIVDPLNCSTVPQLDDGPYRAAEDSSCTLQPGNYAIGLDGVPAGWTVSVSCTDGSDERIDAVGASFTFYGFSSATCVVEVRTPVLLLDKVVEGGPADPTDFVIEVYDGQGALLATGSDVAAATCESTFDPTECGAVALPAGTGYALGEEPMADYVVSAVECTQYVDVEQPPNQQQPLEVIDLPGASFDHDDGDTYCVVTNTYVPPPTTTTTTTLVTTTSIDAGVVTLPSTGASSSTNTAVAALAAVLVLLGGAMLAVRRRAG